MLALIGLGVGLMLTDPTTWPLAWLGHTLGPPVYNALHFLQDIRPFGSIFCYALALALFMTRLKF